MHPRTTIRQEAMDILHATLPDGTFIASGRARDVPTSPRVAALVYTPFESVRQESSSDLSPDRPAMRIINLSIVIQSKAPGDGSEAMAEADALSRDVEQAINSTFWNYNLTRTESGVSAAGDVVAEVVMTYDVEFFDGE